MEKGMFREKIHTKRCVIPATGFYEWNRQKEKCEFSRTEQEEMFLAGFYGAFAGENRFVILTTEANPSVAPGTRPDAPDPGTGGGGELDR